MCNIIDDKKEAEELINSFFFPITSLKSTLINLSNYKRHAFAYGSDCTLRLFSWYDDEEKNTADYIGDGNIEIIGWEPYFDKDIKVILTSSQFWGHLEKYANKYEQEYPTDKIEISHYMNLVKSRLNI